MISLKQMLQFHHNIKASTKFHCYIEFAFGKDVRPKPTFSSNCEYLSVCTRNISDGGIFFWASFAACIGKKHDKFDWLPLTNVVSCNIGKIRPITIAVWSCLKKYIYYSLLDIILLSQNVIFYKINFRNFYWNIVCKLFV